jgi:type IV pilus assembly protein PilY1
MKNIFLFYKSGRNLFACITLLSGIQHASATPLDLAQSPLILSESVAPNMIFTLDDSGSMRYARVPDTPIADSNSRRIKSGYYNPLYYNPTVTYPIPIKYNDDGSRASTQYNTSFATAYKNGFNTGKGSVNLSTKYRVTWTYDPYGDGSAFPPNADANNPSPDYYFNSGAFTSNISGTQTSPEQTINNINFTVTRTSSGCTATIVSPTDLTGIICSRSNNTYQVTTTNRSSSEVSAYYYVFDTTQPSCTQTISNQKEDDNCYKRVIASSNSGVVRASDVASGTNELDNFARWYSFYRNRALTTMSAANIAFSGLPSSVRLTWQRLNSCNSFNDSGCKNYLRKFTQYQRGNFFNWLINSPFVGGTPLRVAQQKAGEFIKLDDAWAYNPRPLSNTGTTGSTVQNPMYSCRANYHLLMTDGLWNGADGSTTASLTPDQKIDTILPDTKAFTGQHPFKDDTQKTLSDLAFHYWATDAADLANDIKPIIQAPNTNATIQYWDPRNDPATWQHLNTYTIGVGLTAALDNINIPWSGDTYSGTGYQALASGSQNWPAASSNNKNNVYDLWHAAINSRGEFFSADTPEAIVNAFSDIISRISNKNTSAGAPGVTASIVNGTLDRDVYETKFNSEDWSGELIKFGIPESGVRTQIWSAQSQISSIPFSSRNIKMYSGQATNKLQDFNWSNLDPTTQQSLLDINHEKSPVTTDGNGEARVNYIRGDQSNEGTATGKFRIRSSVLGDIINSSPVIVGTPKYVAYLADKIDGGTNTDGSSKYAAFKTANRADKLPNETTATPRRPMIYVGANDGMLHGFDAVSGEEIFAYIPSAVITNLSKLTGLNYTGSSHQYYVDGTPTVADVYYDNAWHTILVGTLRAGGRSIFALDITNPDAIKLLWEKSSTDTDYGNLGYTFAQPVIARLHTGNWAVVLGNGYSNQDDSASLMVINIQTGAMQKELIVPSDITKPNGLSSVKLADNNSDGIADYAYAGDLQGNMWRFDLVTTGSTAVPAPADPFRKDLIGTISASSFKISYNNTPLYTAIDGRTTGAQRQPITAPPSLVRHPTSLGYLVTFGTGKYFEKDDGNVDNTHAETLYGIWDRQTKGENTSTRTSPTRSDLQAQTITEQASNTPFISNQAVEALRLVSNNPVQWYNADTTVNRQGWRLDFKVDGTASNNGEMLINPMSVRGKVLLLNTLTPNSNPCAEGVDSWLYGLDPTTGGRTNFNVFDLNNDKVIDSQDSIKRSGADTVVSSYKKDGSGGFTTNNGDIFTAPSEGGGMKYNAGPTSKGRQSWRIIPEEAQ